MVYSTAFGDGAAQGAAIAVKLGESFDPRTWVAPVPAAEPGDFATRAGQARLGLVLSLAILLAGAGSAYATRAESPPAPAEPAN